VSTPPRRANRETLKDVIERIHSCKAERVESVPVREVFNGRAVWEGVVEVFEITGHPKAAHCYGWSYKDGRKTRFMTVLELPPVDSARKAVQVAIAAEAKQAQGQKG